ncbi:orotate phosphoribosyltransferase [Spirochaeta cellobiosiphila]|uniref:orotate phosphoribosyltransferase n=1 Tax=Spirochaeta cellobiosiphila TaxID=504483 RepID=UPI0004196D96|nr:orotate phosphoribosyltransferase [Spirochaeta cellobiosiphila]
MEQYKEDFITFMVRSGVLTFGDFTTKSGRKTPFFINTGNYDSGDQMAQLGKYYGEALMNVYGEDFDVLFGPAYKGIPLVITTAMALSDKYKLDKFFAFNRKEAKDHGEGGNLIGHKLKDGEKLIIVEDVTTAGTSIRESIPLLQKAADVKIKALLVSVDRQEKGTGDKSALAQIEEDYGIQPIPIVTLDEIVEYLYNRPIDGTVYIDDTILERIKEYRTKYGA